MLVRRVELWKLGLLFMRMTPRVPRGALTSIYLQLLIVLLLLLFFFLTRATDLSRKGGAACGLQTATELAEI